MNCAAAHVFFCFCGIIFKFLIVFRLEEMAIKRIPLPCRDVDAITTRRAVRTASPQDGIRRLALDAYYFVEEGSYINLHDVTELRL